MNRSGFWGQRPLGFHRVNLEKAVLHILRRSGPMPQVHIAKTLDASAPTLSRTVKRMTDLGLLAPVSAGAGKRKRPVVGLNGEKGHVIGIEYAARIIRAAVLAFDGDVRHTRTRDINVDTADHLLEQLIAVVRDLSAADESTAGKLLAVGAVDCGLVDITRGVSVASSIFPAWHDVNVRERLEDALGVPVCVVPSAAARLAAVDQLELCGQCDDVLLLEYGQGIACAIKSAGTILRGSRGMAGEFGHTHVSGDDTPCPCGSVGCLEGVAAVPAIGKQAQRDGRQVLDDARNEDKLAMRIVDQAFERIGTALGNLVNVLNPAVVVLDPLLAQAGEAAVEQLRRAMIQQIMPTHVEHLKITVSKLTESVAPLGGAHVALENLIEIMPISS